MEFYPVPQPDDISEREKEDATGAYLMMFASVAIGLPMPLVNIIASVVYYFVNRNKGLFVKFHSLQSLYSQLPVSLLNSFVVIWAIVNLVKDNPFTNIFWGLAITAAVLTIIYFTFSIIAAVRAHQGRFYYFIFFGKLSYMQAFRKTEEKHISYQNKPPAL
jgi:uncharacterized Tic20 family protein